jgi:hypothetical protein
MEQIKKLILPQRIEVIFMTVVAVSLLLILNIKRFQSVLEGYAAVEASGQSSWDSAIGGIMDRVDTYISADILDIFVWLIIGCLGFVVISTIIAAAQTAKTEYDILHYYKKPSGRHHEIIVFVAKIATRLASLIIGLVWLSVFLSTVMPFCVKFFFTSVTTISDYQSWFWAILTTLIMATSLYSFVIILRLLTLKARLF